MQSLKFIGIFPDGFREVKLSYDQYGTHRHQIMIDGYYHGILYFRNGAWAAHLNDKSELDAEQIAILGRILMESDQPQAQA